MASTSIFAPQVRSVQPAFIYNEDEGKVKIYFSISSYNKIDDIRGILYTLIDPNIASTWGDNSIIKADFKYKYTSIPQEKSKTEIFPVKDVEYYIYDDTNKAYILQKNLTSFKDGVTYYYANCFEIEFNLIDFKKLTKNQFYQVQLYFVDATAENFEATQEWLNENKNYISEPSQITLIRPIAQPSITIIGNNDSNGTYTFATLTGYTQDKIETFDSYYCEIEAQDFKSPIIQGNGQNFSIPIDNAKIIEGGAYRGKFYYTTINGYSGDEDFTILYKAPEEKEGTPGYPEISLTTSIISPGMGGIIFDINHAGSGEEFFLQRSVPATNFWEDISYPFLLWEDISYPFLLMDQTLESDTPYFYRVVHKDGKKLCTGGSEIFKVDFEDIFLSDENFMIPIRYNSNISNFKYVSQDSIINTLGGKYPIVRKNGDTKYRQFNLSGSIYLDIDYGFLTGENEKFPQLVSWSNSDPNFDKYIREWGLYVSFVRIETLVSSYIKLASISDKYRMETEVKKIIMSDFLCNGTPKLFRSKEEGNMIVYLSNISFTPNKQLGRHIYDFSATVTEICEYNSENIKKYNLNNCYYPLAFKFPKPKNQASTIISSLSYPIEETRYDSLQRE